MTTEIPHSLGDYASILRRRWVWLVTVWPAILLLAIYLAYTLPTIYRSSGTILLEASSIPNDLIRTTVTAFADEQLELVSRQLLTTENLEALVQEYDPYPELDSLGPREKARRLYENVETERVDPITLKPVVESNAFSVHYYNPDAEIAKAVADRLAQMFLSFDRKSRMTQATETYDFLRKQSEEASRRIIELEQDLADFKEQYGRALPESSERNLQAIERLQDEIETLQQRILLAQERKRSLELQLTQITPNLFDPAGDWRAELAGLRAELAAAQQRYTSNHPTVTRLQRAISELAARVEASEPEQQSPDNPEYIQVSSQLDTVNQELSVMRASESRARSQLQAYQQSLEMAPEVERDYRRLVREHQVAVERFAGIEASLSEAAMGQVLESESRGQRLTLIRAPFIPKEPYSPNRLGITLLGIVLGGALAVGLAALVESSDPSIRSARDLAELSNLKPIASVPVIMNAADRRRRILAWMGALSVGAVSIGFVVRAVLQAVAVNG